MGNHEQDTIGGMGTGAGGVGGRRLRCRERAEPIRLPPGARGA